MDTIFFPRHTLWRFVLCASLAWPIFPAPALAQAPATVLQWQQCRQLADDPAARLACFDQWAAQQPAARPAEPPVPAALASQHAQTASAAAQPPLSDIEKAQQAVQQGKSVVVASNDGCRNPAFDQTARFWELDKSTDCGNFRLRGYKANSFSVTTSNRINQQPYTPSHGYADFRDYGKTETRLQLSIRTKLASNLLTRGGSRRDSLWLGYTQQSLWQLFNAELSRPFRTTDHEPELLYIYPLEWRLPGGSARLRFAGLGFSHQSNGQSDPLSRSWNRTFMTFGMDLTPRLRATGRIWQRISEDPQDDDNPGISGYVGRAELQTVWDVNPDHTLALTVRHSLSHSAHGSAKLDWSRTLGGGFAGGKSNLRLHTSIFTGYGDSLIDYNVRRTVFSIGISLLDF